MKKTLLFLGILLGITATALAQVKIAKATKQKRFAGRGGIFMNYTIGLKSKTNDSLLVDSIQTIGGGENLNFYFNRTDRHYCEFSFGYALSAVNQCGTCPDVRNKKQPDIEHGVVVYYKTKNEKYSVRVKRFKRLPDLMLP